MSSAPRLRLSGLAERPSRPKIDLPFFLRGIVANPKRSFAESVRILLPSAAPAPDLHAAADDSSSADSLSIPTTTTSASAVSSASSDNPEADAEALVPVLEASVAQINRTDDLGNYPLYYACVLGSPALVRLLFRFGATCPNLDSISGRRCHLVANQTVRELLEQAHWQETGKRWDPPNLSSHHLCNRKAKETEEGEEEEEGMKAFPFRNKTGKKKTGKWKAKTKAEEALDHQAWREGVWKICTLIDPDASALTEAEWLLSNLARGKELDFPFFQLGFTLYEAAIFCDSEKMIRMLEGLGAEKTPRIGFFQRCILGERTSAEAATQVLPPFDVVFRCKDGDVCADSILFYCRGPEWFEEICGIGGGGGAGGKGTAVASASAAAATGVGIDGYGNSFSSSSSSSSSSFPPLSSLLPNDPTAPSSSEEEFSFDLSSLSSELVGGLLLGATGGGGFGADFSFPSSSSTTAEATPAALEATTASSTTTTTTTSSTRVALSGGGIVSYGEEGVDDGGSFFAQGGFSCWLESTHFLSPIRSTKVILLPEVSQAPFRALLRLLYSECTFVDDLSVALQLEDFTRRFRSLQKLPLPFSGEYQSRDPSTHAHLPRTLMADLRGALNNPMGSDLLFVLEGKALYAHKWILTARSDYFRAMFTGPFVETNAGVVDVEDVRYSAFLHLLEFLYTNTVARFLGRSYTTGSSSSSSFSSSSSSSSSMVVRSLRNLSGDALFWGSWMWDVEEPAKKKRASEAILGSSAFENRLELLSCFLNPEEETKMTLEVFALADQYQLVPLFDLAKAFLKQSLTPVTIPLVYFIACKHDVPDLIDACAIAFGKQMRAVRRAQTFDELSTDLKTRLFNSAAPYLSSSERYAKFSLSRPGYGAGGRTTGSGASAGAAGGGGGGGVVRELVWQCGACTLENAAREGSCKACGAKKPPHAELRDPISLNPMDGEADDGRAYTITETMDIEPIRLPKGRRRGRRN